MITSRSVLLIMRNVSDKFAEKIETHILCSITPPPPKKSAVYEAMWRNRHSQTGQRKKYTCMLDTEYLILNACQRQQWLCKGASMLRCTYTAVLFIYRYVIFNPYVCSGCVHSFGSDSATTAIWLCPHNHTFFRKLNTKLRSEPGNVL